MKSKTGRLLGSYKDLIVIVTLSLLVVAIYFQVTGFGFINLDDNLYVYNNPPIASGLTGETLRWAFTSFWSANWHPLTWLSHSLDVQLFGMDPGRHHVVSVLIHLINSILVFVVFRKMTGREWESFFVAALFAVHPAHVESVAWVSERKDVLSTLFWLLAMLAYTAFAQTARSTETADDSVGTDEERSPLLGYPYLLTVLFLALGLMAKPMLVTVPFVLLLCDLWPFRRLVAARDVLPRVVEKLPLFALVIASSIVTFLAQRSVGAVESLDYLPLSTRIANAIVSYGKYILMLFYPADLAVFYPYELSIPVWQIVITVVLLLAVTALCLWQVRRRPFLLVGWLWFLGTLVPVIGVLQVGSQSLADRYTYVPYLGLFVMLVWGVSSLVREQGFGRKAFQTGFIGAIVIFAALAFKQAAYWRDNESLYRHTLAVTVNNFLIAHNLCHHFVLVDRLDEAEPLCRQAIEIRPNYNEPYNTLGILEFKRGNFAEAEKDFKESLKYAPQYVFAYTNLAQSQSRQGKAAEAEESLRLAVEYNGGGPSNIFISPLTDIAAAYAAQQNFEKSADNLKRILYIQPDNSDARARLALTLYFLKRYDEAETEAQNALRLKQNSAEAWNALGMVKLAQRKGDEAATAFQQVLAIAPDFPEARSNLEKAQAIKQTEK